MDKKLYIHTPDYAMNLTSTGESQARIAGETISDTINRESVAMYVSPYFRTRQTACLIRRQLKSCIIDYKEDARLREQEWSGSLRKNEFMHEVEAERDSYGHFYYRFENGGESCADVYDRLSTFLETIHRDFKKDNYPDNTIIVTHGMTMRLFLMRWFHFKVEEFEELANPKNCEIWTLKRYLESSRFKYSIQNNLRRYTQPRCKFPYKEPDVWRNLPELTPKNYEQR